MGAPHHSSGAFSSSVHPFPCPGLRRGDKMEKPLKARAWQGGLDSNGAAAAANSLAVFHKSNVVTA